MKFLHIADIHLGCTRYQLPESPQDFFDAWIDVLQRYAIDEQVDFAIMAGDFFHKKNVSPETMNHAIAGLTRMRDAGIPVIAIEGNHDQKHTDSDHSWLRSLSTWGFVKLLEPKVVDGEFTYEPWDEEKKTGGYFDIGRARIFGSSWFGASGNWAIPMLTKAIAQNQGDSGTCHILMLHTDVEGHQTHPIPALSIDALRELKSVTDYVALGHTHMHFEIDNWAFNPGSIEVTNIAEFRETRGAFLVEVDGKTVKATHLQGYTHRPFQQLSFDVSGCAEPSEVTGGALNLIRTEARVAEEGKPAPIIEIALRGMLGFPNSELEMSKIRDEAKNLTGALHIRMKNHTVQPDDSIEQSLPEEVGREIIERNVVETLVRQDSRFKDRAYEVSNAVVGAKRMVLNEEEPGKIAEYISQIAGGGQCS